MFLPHKCKIYTVSLTNINGSTIESKVLSYSGSCMFYNASDNYKGTSLGQQTDLNTYNIIIGYEYVILGDVIEVTGFGKYMVKSIEKHYSKITGNIDNLLCEVISYD